MLAVAQAQTLDPLPLQTGPLPDPNATPPGPVPPLPGPNATIPGPNGPLAPPLLDPNGPLAPPPPDPNGPLDPPLPDPNGPLAPPNPNDPSGPSNPLSPDPTPAVLKCKKKTSSRILSSERGSNHRKALRNAKGHGVRSSNAVKEDDFEYFYFYPDGRHLQLDPNAPSDPNTPPLPDPNDPNAPPLPDPNDPNAPSPDPPSNALNDPAPPKAKSSKAVSKKKGKNIDGNGSGNGLDGGWCPSDASSAPTGAPSPSSAPSISPKPTPKRACKALDNNEPTPKTNSSVEVIFRYNMIRKKSVPAVDAIKTVSDFIQKELAGALLHCPSSSVFTSGNMRTLIDSDTYILGIGPGRLNQGGDRNRRSLQVESFEKSGSGSLNMNVACSSKIQGIQTAATNCDTVDDSVTVYMVPNSPESSPSTATDDTLTAIRTLMDTQAGAIFAASNGIQGLLFLGQPGGSTSEGISPPRIQGNSNASTSSGLSGAGVGLIIGSCILLLVIAIVAVRRRRVTQYKTRTAYEEDDVPIFSKSMDLYSKTPYGDTETVSTTSSNWRRARSAHVMGEGDSVSPMDTGCIMDDLRETESRSLYGSTPRSGGLDDELLSQDSHDVHRCQSATCDVCAQRRGLVFVSTDSPESYMSIRSPARRSYQSHDTVHL